jgi:catechol 2,3-dioxygenase-like lactoylglutathione lyase family enzyme
MYQLHTYSEVVFSVGNLDKTIDIYTKSLGFELVHRTSGDASQIDFWGLPVQTQTEEALLRFQGLRYGQLRLIKFKNIEQRYIRPAGQTWDTGGILDIDLRTSDIQQTYNTLVEEGWHAYAKPVSQTMGPFTVQEVLLKGHDEVVIAFVHRSEPPHPNPFNLDGITSNIYLSAMIVRDLQVAKDFFVDKLGFILHNDIAFKTDQPEATMFGLPHNLSNVVNVKLNIIGPENNRDGLLDLVELEGVTGEDFATNACPPNRGILMYRFPVSNINQYYQHLLNQDIKMVCTLKEIVLSEYGQVKIFAVQSPDGVWLEFFEKI